MRLISLVAENFKRLRCVHIEPTGACTSIVGRNGAGKTSVLDAICAAIGGAAMCPEMPIRNGEPFAEVKVDLGDIVASRFWKRGDDGKVRSNVQVMSKDGALLNSPQAVLDKLFEGLAFSPLDFMRLAPGAQAATLARIAGLDLEQHEGIRRGVFAERTDVNRQHKLATAQLAGMPVVQAPDEEVSVDAVAQRLQEAIDANTARLRLIDEAEKIGERHAAAVAKVDRLRKELAAAEADELRGRVALAAAKVKADATATAIDPEPIRAELRGVEATNARVRQAKARTLKVMEVAELREKAEALTARIELIDQQKADAIAAAKLPVPGLALGETGVLLHGIPLSQCSGAERLRVSVAIGLALNPKLKLMLIRDGSLLDADGMRLLAELAEAADAQVLIERVSGTGECGIVIEDGEVVPTAAVAEVA